MEEAEILKAMKHRNVVKFREVFESKDFIFLVMDHIRDDSLRKLMDSRMLSDIECSIIIKNILLGLHYIHSRNYIHRDLKPENVLLMDRDDLSSVVIVDFGLGIKYQRGIGSSIKSKVGTTIYMAPEQATSATYGKAVDIWSVGLIMYSLISGYHPLYLSTDSQQDYLNKLAKPHWKFTGAFTILAKDFFLHMCNIDPNYRYDTATAQDHPWITRNEHAIIPKTLHEQLQEFTFIAHAKATIRSLMFISYINNFTIPVEYMAPQIMCIEKSDAIEIITKPMLGDPYGMGNNFKLYKDSLMSKIKDKGRNNSKGNRSEVDIFLNLKEARIQTAKHRKAKCLEPIKAKGSYQNIRYKSTDTHSIDVNALKEQLLSARALKPLGKAFAKNKSNPNLLKKAPSKHIIL